MDELNELSRTPSQAACIKVVGVGGGGCNAVDRMIAESVQGVDFVAVNTDAQTLQHSQAGLRIQIGADLTRGLGSGGNPVTGQSSAEENEQDIARALQGADMVFVTGGMGGGTGTGSAPIVAGLAQDMGILTVGVVTLPFAFEGRHRRRVAEQGIEQLRPVVDTLIVIPNDRLLQTVTRHTSMLEAFRLADQVLLHGIRGISDLITRHGIINVDFADARAIMAQAGTAWMAIGQGSGQSRMVDAVTQALTSPLLEVSITGARGVLCNIVGGPDLSLTEVNDGLELVRGTVDNDANIIHGVVIDPTVKDGDVRVTLIATGFNQTRPTVHRATMPRMAAASEPSPQPEATADTVEAEPESPPPLRRLMRTPPGLMQPQPAAAHSRKEEQELDIPPFLRRRVERQQTRMTGEV